MKEIWDGFVVGLPYLISGTAIFIPFGAYRRKHKIEMPRILDFTSIEGRMEISIHDNSSAENLHISKLEIKLQGEKYANYLFTWVETDARMHNLIILNFNYENFSWKIHTNYGVIKGKKCIPHNPYNPLKKEMQD